MGTQQMQNFNLISAKLCLLGHKQHWDIGVNSTKVCHFCCGIIMTGNNRNAQNGLQCICKVCNCDVHFITTFIDMRK